MLFPYKYKTHNMEEMQKYMDYIFYEVWVQAKNLGDFDENLFDSNKELKNIIKAFNFLPNSPKWGKYFLERVKNIFEFFKKLNDKQIQQLIKWYEANNNIEKLCNNKLNPVIYKELKIFHKDLSNEISMLYSKLYDKKIIGLKDIKDNINSSIESHYKYFMTINSKEICPFCGLHTMKGIHHTKREAYDHYLPKGQYPFNSINFKNLAPMCHECNSSYKLENNPIYDKSGKRRKTFYPYQKNDTQINVNISIVTSNKSNIIKKDIKLVIVSPYTEEMNTWKALFGIEERYKAVCSGINKDIWINQILDEAPDLGLTPEKYLEVKVKHFTKNPYTDEKNFLKVPFLKACKNIGIFK